MRMAFFDVSYHRTSNTDDSSQWPVNVLSYVSIDLKSSEPCSEHSISVSPAREPGRLDNFLERLSRGHDLIVGHNLSGDYRAISRLSPVVHDLVPKTVDTMVILWEEVLNQFPNKRRFGAGLSLERLHLQVQEEGTQTPVKKRGEPPILDCFRIMGLWGHLLNNPVIYEHDKTRWDEEARDVAIISVEPDKLQGKLGSSLLSLELCQTIQWPDYLKDKLDEHHNEVLNYTLSFVKGAAQERVRSRLGTENQLRQVELNSMTSAMKWARDPELMMLIPEKSDSATTYRLKSALKICVKNGALDAACIPHILHDPLGEDARKVIESVT